MTRDRITEIGFQHPKANRRKLTLRSIAFAELITTLTLVLSIAIAATAVSIGIASADALAMAATGRDGAFAVAAFLGFLIAGMGLITAAVTRAPREKPQPD